MYPSLSNNFELMRSASLFVLLSMSVIALGRAEQIEEFTSRDYNKIDSAFKKYTQLIFFADKCSTWLRSKDTLSQDCKTYLENVNSVTKELFATPKGKMQLYLQKNFAARDFLVRSGYVLADTETQAMSIF